MVPRWVVYFSPVTAPKPKGLGFKGMPPHPFALFRAQLVGVEP